jgi:quinohemoprotein ethanol dehydrogenase
LVPTSRLIFENSPLGMHSIFKDIVLKGVLAPRGMERFDDLLTEEDVDAIHAYIIDESWKAYTAQQSRPKARLQ